jgi:hypothetical protein
VHLSRKDAGLRKSLLQGSPKRITKSDPELEKEAANGIPKRPGLKVPPSKVPPSGPPRLVKSFSEMEAEDESDEVREQRQQRREEDQSGFFPVLAS